jgi:hypothetical protein
MHEDLKNKDIQIELRKKYYDNLSAERQVVGHKGEWSKVLCYCNRFYSKKPGSIERHKLCKTHQDYCIKIKNEIEPGYLLCDDEIFYRNQFIKYYYFTKIN